MKKKTLLFSFIASALFANAQNLVINPSFEGWINGKPSLWVASSGNTSFTVSQEKTIVSNGTSAFKLVTDGTNDAGFHQVLPVTPGKTYTLSVDYYVATGDGTDASINCNFLNGTKYLTDAELSAEGILEKLKSVAGNPLYLQGNMGTWHTYTCDFVAPASTTEFDFEIRSHRNSTVIFDNRYFGEKVKAGLSNNTANDFNVKVIAKNILQINAELGSIVDVFNASGVKVQTATLTSNTLKTNNLPCGVYVVSVGKNSQKVILQ
jgi:hypothetical protein